MTLNAAIMPQDATAVPYVPREDKVLEEKAYARPELLFPYHPIAENKIKILSPLSLPEIWSNLGAPEPILEGLTRQSADVQEKLAARTEELFSNRDFLTVLHQIGSGKPKNIDKLLGSIAAIPPEMDIITLAYTRITPEQNKDVWQEFQSRSEPAFYRHLAANHADELKAAGFCDYALSCLSRGLSPTTEDGMPYNVDVDHIVERAGGGKMSTEKSIDPVAGGDPAYPINHIGNLCLIMKSWHHSKNDLNGAQNIGSTPVGQTQMLCMAVPPLQNRTALLSAELVEPYLPPTGRDSIYFTQGASLLLAEKMNKISEDATLNAATGQKLFDSVFKDEFNHTLNVWTRVTEHIEKLSAEDTLHHQEAGDLQKTCNEFLYPLVAAAKKVQVPQDRLENLAKIGDRMQSVIAALQAPKQPEKAKPQQQVQKSKGTPNGHA